MYFILILFVTLGTLLLPWFMPKLADRWDIRMRQAPVWLPFLAAVLYFTSLFLPDIGITAETDTFQQHFMGGGVYTAMLYIYFSSLFGWRPKWSVALATMFAWTSALGILNELLEFALTKLHITDINITDTSWDLVANTSGMLATFISWRFIAVFSRRNKPGSDMVIK